MRRRDGNSEVVYSLSSGKSGTFKLAFVSNGDMEIRHTPTDDDEPMTVTIAKRNDALQILGLMQKHYALDALGQV
jgi:hypothetical protein